MKDNQPTKAPFYIRACSSSKKKPHERRAKTSRDRLQFPGGRRRVCICARARYVYIYTYTPAHAQPMQLKCFDRRREAAEIRTKGTSPTPPAYIPAAAPARAHCMHAQKKKLRSSSIIARSILSLSSYFSARGGWINISRGPHHLRARDL